MSDLPSTAAIVDILRRGADLDRNGEKVSLTHGAFTNIADRIEALVRLTSEQQADILALRKQVQTAGSPVIQLIELVSAGPDDLDAVVLIATRKGHIVAISDGWIDVWKTKEDFETGLKDRAVATLNMNEA